MFKKEKDLINNIAISNVYSRDIIDQMMKEKMFQLRIKEISTLGHENRETKFFSVPYHHYSRHFDKIVFKPNQTL